MGRGDWIQWLIILIPIAIWILSNLFSTQREQTRRQAGAGEESPRRTSSSSELESFLEEMRQRKPAQERPVEPVVVEEAPRSPPAWQEAKPEAPKPPPVPRREERRPKQRDERGEGRGSRSRPVGSKPPQRRAEPVIVVPVEPAPAPPLAAPPVVLAAPTIKLPTEPPSAPPPPLPPARFDAPRVKPPPRSPAAQIVADLIKNRQAVAAAFLLREILDRPLCQRRRHD
jgi:hypothetical protein